MENAGADPRLPVPQRGMSVLIMVEVSVKIQ